MEHGSTTEPDLVPLTRAQEMQLLQNYLTLSAANQGTVTFSNAGGSLINALQINAGGSSSSGSASSILGTVVTSSNGQVVGSNTINNLLMNLNTKQVYGVTANGSTVLLGAVVPEPGTYALMGLGLAGIALLARRRRASPR